MPPEPRDWVDIGQAIGGYSGIVAVFIALTAAFIAYRSRPLKIHAAELHSTQLRETIDLWIGNLSSLPDSPRYPTALPWVNDWIDLCPDPEPYALGLEADVLFGDLQNHVAKQNWARWRAYKTEIDKYRKQKQRLTQAILESCRSATGLRIHGGAGGLPNEELLTHSVVSCLFEDLHARLERESPYWFRSELIGPNTGVEIKPPILNRGGRGLIQCVGDNTGEMQKTVYLKLCGALDGDQGVLTKMSEHCVQFKSLEQHHSDVIAMLQEWLKVPILPNESRLLKRGEH